MADEKGEKAGAAAGKKRPGYYFSDEMIQVVKDHAARGGLSESAAAEDLIARGAAAAAAQGAGAQAVPAIAAAVGRTVEELLRAVVVQPFGAELAANPSRRRWPASKGSRTWATTTAPRSPSGLRRRPRSAPARRARRARWRG